MDGLCPTCTRLPPFALSPTRLLIRRHQPNYALESLPLGTFSRLQSHANCPLCRLIIASITEFRTPATYPSPSTTITISWQSHTPGYTVSHAMPNTLLSFIEPLYGSGAESESSERDDDGFWSTLAIQRARRVDSGFGFVFPDWLDNCRRFHGEQCSPSIDAFTNFARAEHDFQFRLIDVRAMKVVEFGVTEILAHALLGSAPKYVALSYVWGGVVGLRLLEGNRAELMSDGGLERRKSEIPRTVVDAIVLTRRMPMRYLWVDALCLVQDDRRDKERSIPRMAEVYAGAEVTIIAAAGPDANTGLPGVNGTPRRGRQVVEEVRGVEMAVVNAVGDMLEISHHATRGWTFQEQLLANRTVVFTPDGGIHWRCLNSVWSEDTNDDDRPRTTTFEPDYLYMALSGSYPVALAYDALVLHYTDRSLTDQADALNAFAGMQKLLEMQFGAPFLQGIPPSAFDFFILFTGHWRVLKRRKEFPSWSWAGWIGKARIDQRGELQKREELMEWLEKRTWIRWYTVKETGERDEIWKPSSTLAGKSVFYGTRCLFDNRHCPDVKADEFLPSVNPKIPPSITTLRFWTLSVHFKVSVIVVAPDGKDVGERADLVDKDGKLVGSVHLDDHFLAADKLEDPFELIVLSETKETQGGSALVDERGYLGDIWDLYWVMLLTRDETGVAERRGLGQIYQKAVSSSFEPGPQWKEIALA
ncbi:hypothetical protein OQA88_3295 [Cercophora sp. LCS_1]